MVDIPALNSNKPVVIMTVIVLVDGVPGIKITIESPAIHFIRIVARVAISLIILDNAVDGIEIKDAVAAVMAAVKCSYIVFNQRVDGIPNDDPVPAGVFNLVSTHHITSPWVKIV